MNDLKRELAPLSPALQACFARIVERGWFAMGEELDAFESAFADSLGGGSVAGVGNGTDALELALRALGIGPGDGVITQANAGGYATTAIRAIGAKAIYVDVCSDSGLIDPRQLPLNQHPDARAMVVTHLYGSMADTSALATRAADANLVMVEDCAQAHGAMRDGQAAGRQGDLACFSFYPTKNLGALGDAGAVFGRDPALVDQIRGLRQYGWRSKYDNHLAGGRNSRMDELQAACLKLRLPGLAAANARRQAIAARYANTIDNRWINVPTRPFDGSDVFHLFVVLCDHRDALGRHLLQNGIQSDVHYPIPDHRQVAWSTASQTIDLPVTEQRARRILSLPCNPGLTDSEVDQIIEACNRFEP
jgi:dTDP-3-amino-2,3,6-trideoxy-4-keto-D-glucose/dTDP-3-amino-3,4,6-trideoxy-alpha-D-glucose/dTDP-2,6-dideoxy-D-kanosamine transaminase